ncbi:MAG: prolipoprotein diacylglyceryl transferase [Clostridia bacterium]|nr:prolipoprotein diacylglyceryl transferase [Clostridia bacterium]
MYQVEFKLFDFAFRFSPVAFTVFGKDVFWYGIIITVGIILAVLYAFMRAKQSGIKPDHMYDYSIFTIIFGIIGARTYYVLSELDSYNSFMDAIAIWKGGLAIYGGVIGGICALVVTALVKKHKPLRILDCAAPATMIGQMIGRWGNYMNQEAFGCNTDLPWGMRSFVYAPHDGVRMQGTVEYLSSHKSLLMQKNPDLIIDPQGYVHPTFLYESLWNLLGFILINIFYKKKKFDGAILFAYLGWYGLGRLFIEGLRTDSLYLGSTNIRLSQLVALICIVLSVFALVWGTVRAKAAGVTTLYTKTENGKWMMTDALCAEESTEEAEETDAEAEESEADEEYMSDDDGEAKLTDENEDEDISEEAENEEINDTETEETEKKEDGNNN